MATLVSLNHTPAIPVRAPKRHAISPARLVSPGGAEDTWPDYYPTPEAPTRAFVRAIERDYPHILDGLVWEPACGQLHMANVLAESPRVRAVLASDLYEREPISQHHKVFRPYVDDFTNPTHPNTAAVLAKGILASVITNPPFRICQPFIERALSIPLTGGVVMFTRLNFIASKGRADPQNPNALLIKSPPNTVYVYAGRLSLWSARSEPPPGANSGTIDYAVSTWDARNRLPPGASPQLRFLHVD